MPALRSASVFASWTALSRLLGFVRDILLAFMLGTTAVADAFLFAYRFPHLFRNLLAEGALASSLVPVYQNRRGQYRRGQSRQEQSRQEQERDAHRNGRTHQYLSGSLLLSLLAVTFALSVVLAVFMPSVVATLAQGFVAVEETFRLSVDLSRIAIFYLPLVATTALLCAVLSAHGYFALYAAMPLVLNGALIAVLLPASLLNAHPQTLAFTLLATLLGAGVLQSLLAHKGCRRIDAHPLFLPLFLPLFSRPSPSSSAVEGRRGRRQDRQQIHRQIRGQVHQDRKSFFTLFFAALSGHGFVQIAFLVNQYFASKMGTGILSALYYAERLLQLPIGIVAVAMASVLLPEVARLRAQGESQALHRTQSQAYALLLALALPCALGLGLLARPIVATLFQYGAFSTDATTHASALLVILACALPAFTMLRPLLAVLFAFQQARVVLVLSFLSLVVNVWLAASLTPLFGYKGIALAVAIAAWCNMGATLAAVLVKGYWRIERSFFARMAKILLASMVLAGWLLAVKRVVPQPEGFALAWQRGSVLALLIATAVFVYILSVAGLRAFSLQELRRWFSNKKA